MYTRYPVIYKTQDELSDDNMERFIFVGDYGWEYYFDTPIEGIEMDEIRDVKVYDFITVEEARDFVDTFEGEIIDTTYNYDTVNLVVVKA